MTNFVGMDVATVREVGNGFAHQASTVDHINAVIDGLVHQATFHWSGHDQSSFTQDWNTRYRPQVVALRERLEAMAKALLDNARQQEVVSADGSGSAFRVSGSIHGPSASGEVDGPGGSISGPEEHFGKDPTKGKDGKYKDGDPDSHVAVNLVNAQGQASVASADGRVESNWGGIQSYADGSVTVLGVNSAADVHVTADGLVLSGQAAAMLIAAHGGYGVKGNYGSAEVTADASVGADVKGQAFIGKTGVHASGEAFAGGKVALDESVDVGGLGASETAEGWAGIGIGGHLDYGFHNGKFMVGGSGGAALGVGGKIGGDITIDPGEVLHTGRAISHHLRGLF